MSPEPRFALHEHFRGLWPIVVALIYTGTANDLYQNGSEPSQDWAGHLARLRRRLPIDGAPASTDQRPLPMAALYTKLDEILVERMTAHLLSQVAPLADASSALRAFMVNGLAIFLRDCPEFQADNYYRERFFLRFYACLLYLFDRIGRERTQYEVKIMDYLDEHEVDETLPFDLIKGLTTNKLWPLSAGLHRDASSRVPALNHNSLVYPAVERFYIESITVILSVSPDGSVRGNHEAIDMQSYATRFETETLIYLFHILGGTYDADFAKTYSPQTRYRWQKKISLWLQELVSRHGIPGVHQLELEQGLKGHRLRFPSIVTNCASVLQLRQDVVKTAIIPKG